MGYLQNNTSQKLEQAGKGHLALFQYLHIRINDASQPSRIRPQSSRSIVMVHSLFMVLHSWCFGFPQGSPPPPSPQEALCPDRGIADAPSDAEYVSGARNSTQGIFCRTIPAPQPRRFAPWGDPTATASALCACRCALGSTSWAGNSLASSRRRASFKPTSGYMPRESRFSFPAKRYLIRHHLPPVEATSTCRPSPSVSL